MDAVSIFFWPVVMWVEYPALTLVPVVVFAERWRKSDARDAPADVSS